MSFQGDTAPSTRARQQRARKTLALMIGGVLAIAAFGIPLYEFVYKPLLVEVATTTVRQAGWLGQRPTDWNAAALTTFGIFTVAQVAVAASAYLLAVVGITRPRSRAATNTIFGCAAVLGVFAIVMASVRPRRNPGLGPRSERFADRFGVSDPDVLAVMWASAAGAQLVVICCGVLVLVLAMNTWWKPEAPRRPRAAWPWLLPLPVIAGLAVIVQLGASLTRFP